MCHRARRRLFMLLLALAPLAAVAQSYERFSVEPSDPGQLAGVGYVDEEFVFTADVTGAVKYQLRFGDLRLEADIDPDDQGKAVVRHRYAGPGRYKARMSALRQIGGVPIELELDVVVKRRPSAAEPVTKRARFSVAKSDPAVYDDITRPWADFTFTADVSAAENYELYFGDGLSE